MVAIIGKVWTLGAR